MDMLKLELSHRFERLDGTVEQVASCLYRLRNQLFNLSNYKDVIASDADCIGLMREVSDIEGRVTDLAENITRMIEVVQKHEDSRQS